MNMNYENEWSGYESWSVSQPAKIAGDFPSLLARLDDAPFHDRVEHL